MKNLSFPATLTFTLTAFAIGVVIGPFSKVTRSSSDNSETTGFVYHMPKATAQNLQGLTTPSHNTSTTQRPQNPNPSLVKTSVTAEKTDNKKALDKEAPKSKQAKKPEPKKTQAKSAAEQLKRNKNQASTPTQADAEISEVNPATSNNIKNTPAKEPGYSAPAFASGSVEQITPTNTEFAEENSGGIAPAPGFTDSEWRQATLSNPSFTNLKQFHEAFRSGKVTAATFYSVTQELLSGGGEEQKSAGIYLLTLETSANSFALIYKIYAQATPSVKSQLDLALMNYQTPQGAGTLTGLLTPASEEGLVLLALEQIRKAIEFSGTTVVQGPVARNGNDRAVTSFISGPFRSLVPALESLQHSTSSQVTALASQLQSQIVSVRAVASQKLKLMRMGMVTE